MTARIPVSSDVGESEERRVRRLMQEDERRGELKGEPEDEAP